MTKRVPGRPSHHRFRSAAHAQLTLVEHALCPLDCNQSLRPNFAHETRYSFTDKHRNRRQAHVRIGAIDGLSAHDEFYLWGLLSLALSQPEPKPELMATPYFVLRHLGIVEGDSKGGREFELFRAAIQRLAGIRYQNDSFYDPIRGEHRAVAFGFLNYSLPFNPQSSRAWRFAWDPIFFELCQATGGALAFDLPLYRQLDPATRRLYLFLKKLLWRTEETADLELRQLAVNVMGFAPTIATTHLKRKVTHCIRELAARELIQLPTEIAHAPQPFVKRSKGIYVTRLQRGTALNPETQFTKHDLEHSPLFDPLQSIGFDAATIGRLLRNYTATLLEQWADITLAAKERNGDRFFKKSPQAYFIDNIRAAAEHRRTPPDWWRELRAQERRQHEEQERSKSSLLSPSSPTTDAAFDEYLKSEAREAFGTVMQKLVHDLEAAGKSPPDARQLAEHLTRMHFRNKFRQEHGDSR